MEGLKPIQITALPESPDAELWKRELAAWRAVIAAAFGVPACLVCSRRKFCMARLKKALENLERKDE